MEHNHRAIATCEHVLTRPERKPDMLWVDAGQVQAALCLDCAHEANDSDELPDAVRTICSECARLENIPVTTKMADGFYEWHEERWEKQPDTSDLVN